MKECKDFENDVLNKCPSFTEAEEEPLNYAQHFK